MVDSTPRMKLQHKTRVNTSYATWVLIKNYYYYLLLLYVHCLHDGPRSSPRYYIYAQIIKFDIRYCQQLNDGLSHLQNVAEVSSWYLSSHLVRYTRSWRSFVTLLIVMSEVVEQGGHHDGLIGDCAARVATGGC